MGSTYNPSIDQGALQQFRDNFLELAQQTKSALGSSKAVMHLPSKGKTNNLGRIGKVELTEVEGRNPNKSYGDYSIDNRMLTKRRFTKTITIDKKNDINELIRDPQSDILKQIVNAKERVIDRVIASAAAGPVLVGAPDVAPSSISAATDGVITLSAVSGLTYAIIQQVIKNSSTTICLMKCFVALHCVFWKRKHRFNARTLNSSITIISALAC